MDSAKRIARDPSVRAVFIPILSFITILVFIAMGCRLTSNILSSRNGSDANAGTTSIATPEEPIFRDDFNSQLNPEWVWQNEDTSRYRISDNGWLEINGGDESILAGGHKANVLWIALPKDDFEISIHLKSQPLFDFHRVGLLLYEDSDSMGVGGDIQPPLMPLTYT